MHIYFSGIGGVGLGPLALICRDAGYDISGSDMAEGRFAKLMQDLKIDFAIGQDGSHIAKVHKKNPIDWLVISSALPADHPEIAFAKKNGIKISKRADMINLVLQQKNLKVVAVAGTHGKTTISAMLVWLFKQFNMPVSYSVGTSFSFGNSGSYEPGSEYFVYECDEYDRNMLNFKPFLSLITTVDYDHPDIYPTKQNYDQAFIDFAHQSQHVIMRREDALRLNLKDICDTLIDPNNGYINNCELAGLHNRQNAWQAAVTFKQIFADKSFDEIMHKMDLFPGTDRRFERLAQNIYTDYAHHPAEIKASIQLARELSNNVVAVYQPHQNVRQHEIKDEYQDCLSRAKQVYWLPTYLTRENPQLNTLTPKQLIATLKSTNAQPAELDDLLSNKLSKHLSEGDLIVFLGAGDIDDWARRWTQQQTSK
ncbi:MAG: Mur ligase domain-containing protein [Candidatus Woesebacteria bacterium]|jgi:UDP-N-acetylmuramate--alanine ligase